MNKLTFSVFTDIHYLPDTFYSRSREKLKDIQQRAKDCGSAFIIHAGDFTHGPAHHMDFVEEYLNFEIPSYHCLGNHDTDQTSYEETLKAYQMPNDYYYFDQQGFRMVVMNFNYFEQDGKYINYSLGNYYTTTGSIGMMPPFELEWLKETLETSPYPCILISHQSIERDNDGILNKEEVRKVIHEVNLRHPRRVMRLMDNVLYLDLNSCAYDWLDTEHHLYPKELEEQCSLIGHTINVNEAIHAVITLTDDGEIQIKGMEGSFLMGITREMTDEPRCDESGRPATARVSSAHVKLL